MSWECPYWNDNICELNGIECKPGKGHCVLRERFEFASSKIPKEPKNKSEEIDSGKKAR